VRLDLKRLLKKGDALLILALLEVDHADVQIPKGVVGFELDHLAKGSQRIFVSS
jgi:hypothetical protein